MRDAMIPALPFLAGDRKLAEGQALPVLPGQIIHEDVLWSCTTCRACEQACPLFIEFIDRIVGMRRKLVLEDSAFPGELATSFRNMEKAGNPWGQSPGSRGDWAEGLDVRTMADFEGSVDVLYRVGCAGAYDGRYQKVSRAMVKLMNAAGVDFAVLGMEETCNDPARRAGNEYLAQMMITGNVETLNRYRFMRIVTTCPHCFNTIKNEYPQFDGKFEIVHHTQLIAELIGNGKLKPSKSLQQTRYSR